MKFISAVRSEMVKLRDTPHWGIHMAVPLMGAILFVFYFISYSSVDEYKKLKLIAELTAVVFPLLISVIVGLNILQEEKACKFQALLAVCDRERILLAKLSVLYLSGVFSLFCLYLFVLMGTEVYGMQTFPKTVMWQAVLGLGFNGFVLYVIHLFLSLKFGAGISLFWGIFECLQYIMYSNMEIDGIWRYIPFAWSANWLQDVFDSRLMEHRAEWIAIAVGMGCILLLFLYWFSRWEGRKN